MATSGATAAVAVAAQHTSSYRVKFKRKEFLELTEIAKPEFIYQTGKRITAIQQNSIINSCLLGFIRENNS